MTLAGTAVLALACGHTEPFSAPPYGSTQPFDPTPPIRLTLNPAADRGASWLPDGSGILYSAQQLGRADADVCLAELPPGGGSQRRLICGLAAPDAELTNAIESPAATASGRLAFLRASSSIGGTSPSGTAVVVAPALDPAIAAEVQRLPYTIPGEPPHGAVTALRWLDETRLVFVGGSMAYRTECQLCQVDTIGTGLKVVVLDVPPSGPAPVALSGTDFASSVSPGATADEIYFTVGGDGRVFRRLVSSGQTSVAHDFGAAGIARDVHVAGGRLVATVGGRVTFSVDSTLGLTQWDSGGIVHVVDLASGAGVALSAPGMLRRPVLAPAGDRVVTEGYPLILQSAFDPVTNIRRVDTTVSRAGDLYLFTTP
ncbi:MAG: hypothetical protein M3Q93_08550 [Gemmatimonadota bacterium]|nr:hypothetical protein [Gemmatimonadota bacterium]